MWFVFYYCAVKHSFTRHNLVNWFMNRNILISQRLAWHKTPDPTLNVATFKDDETVTIPELFEILSPQERDHAIKLSVPIERRHYTARRCFQRLFVANVLSSSTAPEQLALIHQRDTRPYCAEAPDLNLSFSSSGSTAIACASRHNRIGIDVERLRKVENVIALARRFFTPEEAQTLSNLPPSQQSLGFLHHWTAKEAGLKAIGKGVVFGLNTFILKDKGSFSFEIQGPQSSSSELELRYLDLLPDCLVALVKMNRVGKV
jgi:phosphopantetheinyl transferase